MSETLWAAVCVENPKAQFAAKDRVHAERMAARATAHEGMKGTWEAREFVGLPEVHAGMISGLERLFGVSGDDDSES